MSEKSAGLALCRELSHGKNVSNPKILKYFFDNFWGGGREGVELIIPIHFRVCLYDIGHYIVSNFLTGVVHLCADLEHSVL
jgi:hypothetical protein